jgi:DNA-directed RNA polymerase specialized sigma subunit
MLGKLLGSLFVLIIVREAMKDEKFDREDVNDTFEKLRQLAGGNDRNVRESRQKVWSAIYDLHRELGRAPTTREVAERLL